MSNILHSALFCNTELFVPKYGIILVYHVIALLPSDRQTRRQWYVISDRTISATIASISTRWTLLYVVEVCRVLQAESGQLLEWYRKNVVSWAMTV